MLSSAEIKPVILVLWHTYAIRTFYEDRALHQDDVMWKNNGGMFPNFSRYNSQKWTKMMGSDEPNVRGRRISRASMAQARRDFEGSYLEPVIFALELADRVRSAVAKAIEKDGPSEDDEYEEEVGMNAWEEIVSDPSVRAKFAEMARNCGFGVDASLVQP